MYYVLYRQIDKYKQNSKQVYKFVLLVLPTGINSLTENYPLVLSEYRRAD